MNGVGHIDAGAFQHAGHLAQGVLGLGHRQAIAGNNDHPLSGLEGECTFLGTAAGDVGVFPATTAATG